MADQPRLNEQRRVVVTGMGAITPLGNDVASFWEGLVAGRSGISRISSFDPARVASKVAGEVRGFDPSLVMDRKEIRRHDRVVHYGWAATVEALRDAGFPNPIDDEALAERTGAIIGTGIGGINTLIRDVIEAHEMGPERVGPFLVTAMIPDMIAGFVAIQANVRGPNYATVSACSSSNHAIGSAFEIIRRGDADVMIAGGAEAGIGEIPVAAFSAMRALSTRRNDDPEGASRPFDAQRDGFVLAEGAAALTLESLESATARGATVLGILRGCGEKADDFHRTRSKPDASPAIAAVKVALADAGLAADQIDYINAHGTSTPENDKMEHLSLSTVFGERVRSMPISSNKSMIGHTLSAAGAVEAAFSVMTMREGVIPPTINYDSPDPAIELDVVPNVSRNADVSSVLSNSFGFGGQNTCLVLTREPV
jgi:3-oxoacyl-[acyl-carrier-protein] synthase II